MADDRHDRGRDAGTRPTAPREEESTGPTGEHDRPTGESGTPTGEHDRPTGKHDRRGSAGRESLTAWTAGGAGVVVTAVLAIVDLFWPALVVLLGAVTASGLLLARRGGTKRYVLAGVVYCLGVAIVLELAGSTVPESYARTVLPAVGGLGTLSGVLVLVKVVGGRVVRAVASRLVADESYVRQLWETVAAAGSFLAMAWLAVTFTEKVARYAAVSVGVVTALVLNLLGYEWLVSRFGFEVELVMATFVFCLLLWFHLLDTLHNSWQTARLSATKVAQRRPGRETDGTPERVGATTADAPDGDPDRRNYTDRRNP